MNIVKLTRISYIEDEEYRREEYVNLDHARIIRPEVSGGSVSAIAFGDPGIETTQWRYYAESPDDIIRRVFEEGWRS